MRGGKKMEAEHKKNVFLWKLLRVCVCGEWKGSVRIGCWCEREVEEMSKRRCFIGKVLGMKISKTGNGGC